MECKSKLFRRKNMNNKVTVVLCGKEFSLTTDEPPANFIRLSKELNSMVDDLMDKAPGLSTQSAALLVALNILNYNNKADETLNNLRDLITQYVDESEKARNERDEAVNAMEELRRENENLKTKIACYKTAERFNKKSSENRK